MADQFDRTKLLLGEDAVAALSQKKVCVFGCGGVGGYAIEAIARSGVVNIDVVDGDVVDITNLNRQILALHSTLGEKKTAVAARRIVDINPDAKVKTFDFFYEPGTAGSFDLSEYDCVVDAIDSVRDKLDLIERCVREGIFIISSMGAARKTDPMRFKAADIYETSVCPLARVMRRELKNRGVEKLRVVFSDEPAGGEAPSDHSALGSVAWVPAAAGLLIGREVILHLIRTP